MTNWALDSLIDTVQKYYHKMKIHTDKGNGWLKHSPHVIIMSKASCTVVEKYSRLNSVKDKDSKFVNHQDSSLKQSKLYNNTKPSSTPKQARESCTMAEYLMISKITQEISGRRYDDNVLWQNITQCTVQLGEESGRERAVHVV